MNHTFAERIKYIAIAVTVILQISFFVFSAACIIHHVTVQAGGENESRKPECYLSIRVHAGESLWEISKRYYSSEYKNMNWYVRKIKYLNHMTDENVNAGSYLIIPYYD